MTWWRLSAPPPLEVMGMVEGAEFEIWRCRHEHIRIVLPGFTPVGGCGAIMGWRYCQEPVKRVEGWLAVALAAYRAAALGGDGDV